ncbi:serine hydrolase [uncultured Nitratireductor sp.]|uniref:serine hydrolase domain-containing protein n=1 Tax=uncultured Nitratireductor sp. TaxID=520953 RepID=UPI0025CF7CEB|nr:serine hydrolase domain-containing protein [uncultured Nitratireductor sp.]
MTDQRLLARRDLLKRGAALALLPAFGTKAHAMKNALSPQALDTLQSAMETHVADGNIAGATWLIHYDGKDHTGSAGTFEMNGAGAPMARDTIFRVASITKPVTAALAMMLVDEGTLTLDGPVDELLPELADRPVLKRIDGPLDDTVPADGPVTLRHLLTMTFGLGAIMVFPEAYPIQTAMREAGVAPSWVLPKMSADAYMKKLAELPLAAHPGETFFYNNGLDVAGILIERATGQRLGTVMKERLLAPLGMKDTDFFVPAEKQDRLPMQYGPDFANGGTAIIAFGPEQGIDFSSPPPMDSGAGGLVTTVDDYAAFCRMMLNDGAWNGKRYLRAETVAEMTRDQLTPAQKSAPNAAMFMDDGGAGWGLGMSVGLKKTRPWLTPGSFGWNGGYGTTAYTDPQNGLIGIFLSQQMMSSPEPTKTYVDFWTKTHEAIG